MTFVYVINRFATKVGANVVKFKQCCCKAKKRFITV